MNVSSISVRDISQLFGAPAAAPAVQAAAVSSAPPAAQDASYQTQFTANGALNGALSALQGSLNGLADSSAFKAVTATPSDPTIVNAGAAAGAVLGSYVIGVSNLASAQTLVSSGQASATAAIAQDGGLVPTTLTFSAASGGAFNQDAVQSAKTVNITNANNTLAGIRDAINSANIGVSASIVNSGKKGAPAYHLMLTSSSGADNAVQITSAATAGGGAAADASVAALMNYSPTGGSSQSMTQLVPGADASFTVNGQAMTSATNTVTNAIPGVTLNLLKTGSAATPLTTNLSLSADTATAQAAIANFVNAYNSLNTTLAAANTTQAAGQQPASAIQSIQTQLRSILNSGSTGSDNTATASLADIGISVQKNGSLILDKAKLSEALTNNMSDVAGIFATVGKTTDSLVSYVSSTTNTKPGSHAVNITQLATQGVVVGNTPVANWNAGDNNVAIVPGVNDTLKLKLDGTSSSVTLAAGTYAATQLAALTQSAINGNPANSSAGASATVSVNAAGIMTIMSNRYGSASEASTVAGTTLMGAGTSTAGIDIAGTINETSATGSGQFLTGAAGSVSDGLRLQIAGGQTGARGTVDVSNGYAGNLGNYLTQFSSSISAGAANSGSDSAYLYAESGLPTSASAGYGQGVVYRA